MNIAIIPAKHNSKGLPGKNLLRLSPNEYPLFFRTCSIALLANGIDSVVFVSDSRSMKDMAADWYFERKYKKKLLIIDEPDWLTHDEIGVDEVTYFAIRYIQYHKKMQMANNDLVFVLQPTSCFIQKKDLEAAVSEFSQQCDNVAGTNGYNSLMSCFASLKYYYSLSDNFEMMAIGHDPLKRKNRQYKNCKDILVENGAIYAAKVSTITEHKTFRVPPIYPFIMDENLSIEIDSVYDLTLARASK